MKLLKNFIVFIVAVFIVVDTLIGAVKTDISHSLTKPINVGVVFYTFDDPYVSLLRESLGKIGKENQREIKFSVYDSKNDKAVQNENINALLESGNIDVLVLSLVDLVNDPKEIIDKIKAKNIPVIFVSKRTFKVDPNVIKSYAKAYYVVPDTEHAGELEGKIVIDLWNKNKNTLDRNKDNIMQYIMLQGTLRNTEITDRTKYAAMAIEKAGIKVDMLASRIGNWDEDIAREQMESLFMQYGGRIEVIIANNDLMAIGAVKALQKYGYNKGDKSKYIPVVGIGAVPEMMELIQKGYMAGAVLQNSDVMAEALFDVGMHLVSNVRLDCEEKYKCDESGRIIELPFKEYVG